MPPRLPPKAAEKAIESRFVLWFNGNGIPERYWIPSEEGADYHMTPCLSPLAPFRNDVHVLSGVDNAAAGGMGNGHTNSMSGLMTGTPLHRARPERTVDRPDDRVEDRRRLALPLAADRRLAGVVRREHAAQHELGRIRARPAAGDDPAPACSTACSAQREEGWVNRKRSILDAIRQDATALKKKLPTDDQARVDEHLSGIRDLERSIAGLPPEYRRVDPPDFDGDMKDWPRIAKLQSDLLVQALATRQTRVASYMLTKCQGLSRFPWLGYTSARHHDYTHADGKAPGADGVEGQRVLRDICKWHVEEFAYLVAKLKSIPEGDGTLFDHCCLVYVHEHAEANPHKNSGLAMIVAGGINRLAKGTHTRVTGTVGDIYLTLADEVLQAGHRQVPDGDEEARHAAGLRAARRSSHL